MKKQVLAKNKTALADVLNMMDGKRKGVGQKTARKVLSLLLALEVSAVRGGKIRSPSLMIRAQARKKVRGY